MPPGVPRTAEGVPQGRQTLQRSVQSGFAGRSEGSRLLAPRSHPQPCCSSYWALSPNPSSDGVRYPCPRLPWYRNADSAKRAALPSPTRPWPPAVLSALPAPEDWGRGGGGAGPGPPQAFPPLSPTLRTLLNKGGRREARRKERESPDKLGGAPPSRPLITTLGRAQVSSPKETSRFRPEGPGTWAWELVHVIC